MGTDIAASLAAISSTGPNAIKKRAINNPNNSVSHDFPLGNDEHHRCSKNIPKENTTGDANNNSGVAIRDPQSFIRSVQSIDKSTIFVSHDFIRRPLLSLVASEQRRNLANSE